MKNFYCPYTDRDLPASETTPEHIIPLSLGGANAFTLPVDKNFNSDVGSRIDGVLTKDFLIALRRRAYGTSGHSGRKPEVVLKHSKMEGQTAPVQVTLRGRDGAPIVWDPVQRRDLSPSETFGRNIESRIRLLRFSRLRFAAKVALGAGYVVYGNLFREKVRHADLRLLMNLSDSQDLAAFARTVDLRVWDRFTPVRREDSGDHQMYATFCSSVSGSCILCIPGPRNIGFLVGVLGQFEAMVNVPADTKSFPSEDQHDLGHVILLSQRRMERLSLRSFAARVLSQLESASEPVGVPFAFHHLSAHQVSLCGDFNAWDSQAARMKRNESGWWETFINLKPGKYQYKFLVDGQWLHDPLSGIQVPNCYGSLNSVIEVLPKTTG